MKPKHVQTRDLDPTLASSFVAAEGLPLDPYEDLAEPLHCYAPGLKWPGHRGKFALSLESAAWYRNTAG